MRRLDLDRATHCVPWAFAWLVLLFLMAPLVIVIPSAFNNSSLLQFPPTRFSLRWFEAFVGSASWIDASLTSLKVALVVSMLATLTGLGMAVVLTRFAFPGRTVLHALLMAPLLAPIIVVAIGLYYLFARIGLSGTLWGLIIGHLVITLPYATVVISASLAEVNRQLEDAAVGLGAIRLRAFVEVTLPLIRPSLVVALFFGFLISFDEVVIAIFVTGPSTVTLPRRMWDGIRYELNPTIAAVSTILIVLSSLILLLSELLRRYLKRASGLSERAAAPVIAAPEEGVGAMARSIAARPSGAPVGLRGVTKRFAGPAAVDSISLDVEAGEFVSFLGPSGSGKTTTLMMIAGFVTPTHGTIMLGDIDITHLPPHRRNIGMVYQNYALFPHMTVRRNVAFPLRMRGVARREIAERVDRALALVRLDGLAERLPNELSGGQQQRVALARALVFAPPLLLMDEPLGALDKRLREGLQLEIKRIQREIRSTVIYVTHDQDEALSMSDRIVVMNHGRIEQVGPPSELYERPRTRFVADFLGAANFLETTIVEAGARSIARTVGGMRLVLPASGDTEPGRRLTLTIRPERISLEAPTQETAMIWPGRVIECSYFGDSQRYLVRLDGGDMLTVVRPNLGAATLSSGSPVTVSCNADDLWVVPEPVSALAGSTGRSL
jgi:spermidine/putrescine ABC transporter ATP-binding subunit